MANDRLFLRCVKCGAEKTIYKFYPGGGYGYESIEFIESHLDECHGKLHANGLGDDALFDVVTEAGLARSWGIAPAKVGRT